MLPGIAKQLYADARDHFRAKDMAKARAGFQAVLTLAEDPLLRDTPDAGDLRTLASGFLDLAAATPSLPTALHHSVLDSVLYGALHSVLYDVRMRLRTAGCPMRPPRPPLRPSARQS